VIVCIEHHADWILQCIGWLDSHGRSTIEPTEAAESAWMDHLLAKAERTIILSCNSWYLGANIPGKPRRFMALIGGFPAYAERCAQVAERGYEGFSLN
jgi:hypothetical protein